MSDSLPEQDKNGAVKNAAFLKPAAEAPSATFRLNTNNRELVSLENAFLAITGELNFNLPEPSRIDRIKAGFIEATMGLLLFVGLLLTENL
ncbi:MAG: hypothetical protein JO333_06840 [Verrucomicrobia bacterium]|nr:hypothetical protein [Verrucomicrobiota bacterium]